MARMMATIMGWRPRPTSLRHRDRRASRRLPPGAGVQLVSGEAKGRQLYTMATAGDVFMCDGHGDANIQRFDGVKVGDEVHVDNRKFLAFCYFHRHHVMDDPQFDGLKLQRRADLPAAPGALACRR